MVTKKGPDLLENGNISFYVRHKVISPGEDVKIFKQEQVQRLYMLLYAKKIRLYRLFIIGKKELPSIIGNAKNWAIVEKITKEATIISTILQKDIYETKSQGKRIEPKAELVARGNYSINFEGQQTFLNFELKDMHASKKFEHELNITRQGNYILSIKNPKLNPTNKIPAYSDELEKKFGKYHFIAANPIEFLNYPNTELILIASSK